MKNQECSTCPHTDKCREVWSEENRGPLTARGLVVCSATAFLLPIILAIISGVLGSVYGFSEASQILISLSGFAVGGVIAAVIVNIAKKRFNRQIPIDNCPEVEEE